MKHYVDTNNQIFAFDDEQIALGLANDLTPITSEQLDELLAPTPEQLADQVKAEARSYLNSTDWYVTRMSETGVAIPEDVLAKRAECRELL
jgi:hypothetical protein